MTSSPIHRRGLWTLAGLALFGLFLLATLPASIVSQRIAAVSAGAFRLNEPQGTVWHGSGEIVASIPAQDPLTSRVSWDVSLLRLFTGSLQIHLDAADADTAVNAIVRLGYHRVALLNVNAELPARVAGLAYPPSQLLSPTGRLRIRTDAVALNRDGLSGNLEISWLNAGIRMTESTAFGDYRLEITGRGPAADLHLTTLRGPLEATGQGQWRVLGDGDFSLRGTVAVPASAPPSVAPLADLLEKNGLNVNARLPLGRWLGLHPS